MGRSGAGFGNGTRIGGTVVLFGQSGPEITFVTFPPPPLQLTATTTVSVRTDNRRHFFDNPHRYEGLELARLPPPPPHPHPQL